MLVSSGAVDHGYGIVRCAYGASKLDLTIISSNVIGMLLGCYYSHQFIKYNQHNNLSKYYSLSVALVAFITLAVALLSSETAQLVLGWLGCAVVVAMFGGPLSVIKKVYIRGYVIVLAAGILNRPV